MLFNLNPPATTIPVKFQQISQYSIIPLFHQSLRIQSQIPPYNFLNPTTANAIPIQDQFNPTKFLIIPKLGKSCAFLPHFNFEKKKSIFFLFREDEAVINRYGFNSDGHEVDNLRKFNAIIFVKTCLDLATLHISVEHDNLGRTDDIHVYLKDSYYL